MYSWQLAEQISLGEGIFKRMRKVLIVKRTGMTFDTPSGSERSDIIRVGGSILYNRSEEINKQLPKLQGY